jgi:hypothetical protein
MKLRELVMGVSIWRSNEEMDLLNSMDQPRLFCSFEEREQTVIESLIRKNLLAKVSRDGYTYIHKKC